MKLGTALWAEGATERRALIAPLPSDDSRVVDLNRVEQVRLAKLGEGDSESLAKVLVPPSLRKILESGPRALQRVRQTLAYAEKWAARGDLPNELAPRLKGIQLLPCLPRPTMLRRSDGRALDRLRVGGLGASLHALPRPTLAAVGLLGGKSAGFCLALEDGGGAVLGTWLVLEPLEDGELELRIGGHRRSTALSHWQGVSLPKLRAAEVLLLPAPDFKSLPDLPPGLNVEVRSPFETLMLSLGKDVVHPTVQ
jgi:hypothetical protein